MKAFRDAVESMDMDRLVSLMSADVVFRSPVVHKPYRGRGEVGPILRAVARVFEDFRYEREIGGEGDADRALVFRARVGDREIEGCDFIRVGAGGLVDEFFVMVRPLSGLLAVAEAMRAELEAAESAGGQAAESSGS